ncbi:hypothetical protein [Moorena sp. SIO3B2]|nr:hypothetical protein [Moorena sp. SIO3B2]NEP31747.1 hypothetical protein [Moorena sp. SIO3B2]NEP31772.1 hypothetical protein [Moorena sp. SIO3B2]
MYQKVESAPSQPEDFELPFEGKLSQNNRWVIMANLAMQGFKRWANSI